MKPHNCRKATLQQDTELAKIYILSATGALIGCDSFATRERRDVWNFTSETKSPIESNDQQLTVK